MAYGGGEKKTRFDKDSGRMPGPKIKKHTTQCPESHLLGISNVLLEIRCRIDFPIIDF